MGSHEHALTESSTAATQSYKSYAFDNRCWFPYRFAILLYASRSVPFAHEGMKHQYIAYRDSQF